MNMRPLVSVILICCLSWSAARQVYAQDSTVAPFHDKWAIVVGISKFNDSSFDLKFAANDAHDFYNYLIADGHFAPDHVALLLDGDATRQNVVSN